MRTGRRNTLDEFKTTRASVKLKKPGDEVGEFPWFGLAKLILPPVGKWIYNKIRGRGMGTYSSGSGLLLPGQRSPWGGAINQRIEDYSMPNFNPQTKIIHWGEGADSISVDVNKAKKFAKENIEEATNIAKSSKNPKDFVEKIADRAEALIKKKRD